MSGKKKGFAMGRRIALLTPKERRKLPSVLRFVDQMKAAITSHSPKNLAALAESFYDMAKAGKSERGEIACCIAELLLSKEDHKIFCGDAYEL